MNLQANPDHDSPATAGRNNWPWNRTVIMIISSMTMGTAAYSDKQDRFIFDHSPFNDLLQEHVDNNGWVDYAAITKNPTKLNRYIAALANTSFDDMGPDEKLAILINAYNAFTIQLICEYWNGGKLESIRDIPKDKRWDQVRWQVGANTWSLNQIEHEQIRTVFKEPRIHFVLVCAAISCPILSNKAFQSNQLEEQLEKQTRYAHRHDRWLRYDRENNIVYLTKLYDWYSGDFEKTASSVLAYAGRYSPDLSHALDTGRNPNIRWIDYDWRLNRKDNASLLEGHPD